MRELVDRYKNSGLQTGGGNAAYDKGESGLLTTKNQTKAPTPPLRKNNYSEDSLFGLGSLAKSKLNSALRELYPDNRYKGLFDGIDDKAVEKNLTLADDVIAKNSANPYNKALFPKLPNLRGGLATYYAAAEAGKYKAAYMARKLAYTEATEQPLPDVAKTAKTQTSNKRYVKADLGLNLRSEPGTSKQVIGKLSKGTEVEFTGNKTGKIDNHEWAEIKYGDKTGWVAAEYLNTEMPYDMYVSGRTDNTESETPQHDKTNAQTNNNGAGTRYVGEKTINMRAVPGLRGHTKEKIDYGQSVEYTGNNETLDGIKWAEVKYGNKTGWVIADYLKTQRSPDMPYRVDLADHEGLQNSFYKVTEFFTKDDLQCVFLTKGFLNNYTTLQTSRGDGFAQAKNTFDANTDKNLQISNIPSAPAIYSVAPYSAGPGISKERATQWGHTGIIIDCQKVSGKEDTYKLTYFHTGSSFKGKPYNCAITTNEFKVSDAVTYVNIGNYMK